MLNAKGFFDYCISVKCVENNRYEATIKKLYEYGYRTIAINQSIDADEFDVKKAKKKKGESREQTDTVPEPYPITPVEGCEDMKILNRLTIVFLGQDALHKIIRSPNYKKFQIIAVLPTTIVATMYTCTNVEADIFCFNPENKNHVRRTRKMCNQLVTKGFFFEIPYSPAIQDSSQRKNIINTSHLYHTFAKSRNVIISSGATDPLLIRNPYDVINLGFIFGLNEQQSKNAITHCGREVFLNSVGRRHGKAVMFVENIEKPQSNQLILLDESDDGEMEVDEPVPKKLKH